jgi:glutathione S-transferase
MYTLYYLPGACSLATQVVLHELNQVVKIIDKQQVEDFNTISPVGTVPVLVDGETTLHEGAAILLYLLNKHENSMLPTSGPARQQAIQNIMFANATMHPAYGRLFFIAQNIKDEQAKQTAFTAAAENINQLWQVVEQQLSAKDFLGGDKPSAADIMLAVYSRWGEHFPVELTFGNKTTKMLNAIQAMPTFQKADAAEKTITSK